MNRDELITWLFEMMMENTTLTEFTKEEIYELCIKSVDGNIEFCKNWIGLKIN